MPRTAASGIQNKFIKGLITETEALSFPEDAVTETSNCIFNEKTLVTRRLGIDFESGFATQLANRVAAAVTSFYWKAAAGNGNNSLVVVQVGGTLYFYLQDAGALSDTVIGTITLSLFSPGGAPNPSTTECDFASGNGFLFVSHPNLEPFYVEFNPAGPSVAATQINMKIRDFEGVEDGLAVDDHPTVLSNEHKYNLYNQGWWPDDVFIDNNEARGNPLAAWDANRFDFPANNDVWWYYLLAATDGIPPEYFDSAHSGVGGRGNSPAPKGHYLLNPFNQDRSAITFIPGLTLTSSNGFRPSTIEFFAGRVWYSGVTGQGYSNKIYFSQIIERKAQFGQCYQLNDPTDRDTFDLLPSDGGVITIQDSGTIIKLFALQSSILVFATNGVWSITGSEGLGFKATDYSINKISAVSAMSASSFVSVNGTPAWWNEDGIFLATDSGSGNVQVNSITDQTIKSFFDKIPDQNKRYARGYFNGRTRVVQWVYRSTSFLNLTEAYTFDSVLNFNVITQAFYPWTVDSVSASINGIVVIKNPSSVTKYLCSYPDSGSYKFTFGQERDAAFRDWFSKDSVGVKYSSYFVSGYALHGDAQRNFQPTFVYIYNKTEGQQNVFDFTSQWNFATSGSTGRWSSTQRITIPNDNYSYQYRRIKTRGSGLALQFRIASVADQPFRIIGWSTFETQNSGV